MTHSEPIRSSNAAQDMHDADESARIPPSHEELRWAFGHTTRATGRHWQRLREGGSLGMSDDALHARLASDLGIMGGSCAQGRPYICYQGAGLKIWVSRTFVLPHSYPPTWAGSATVRMAREVYRIPDPCSAQMTLL